MFRRALLGRRAGERGARPYAQPPVGTFAAPGVGVVVNTQSEAASFVTGVTLPVDGGWTRGL